MTKEEVLKIEKDFSHYKDVVIGKMLVMSIAVTPLDPVEKKIFLKAAARGEPYHYNGDGYDVVLTITDGINITKPNIREFVSYFKIDYPLPPSQ